MSEEMTRVRAIGVITLHREHWQRLMQGNVCSKQEGEESIAAFDVALAALSAEPCGDAISRKQACDLALNSINKSITPNDIMRMPRVQPIGRWIPVSERLPKENETVMASTEYGVYPEVRYTKKYGWEWAYEAGADYWRRFNGVTAWMPLPEPYRESEEQA